MKINILVPLIVIILAIGLSACTEKKADDTKVTPMPQDTAPQQTTTNTTPPPVQEPPKTTTTVEVKDPKLKVFHINASNWKFEPKEIKVYKGDKVKIYLTSLDVAHGFAIFKGAYENISLQVEGGETKVLEFNATEVGIYAFQSNVYSGPGDSNMKGTLTVYESSAYKQP